MIMWASAGLGKISEGISNFIQESVGHYELKQHKPLFDEECSKEVS
jgi:hypothetical protein